MPIDKLIAVWLPIALGVVMIGAGLVNFVGPGSVRDSFARWGYPAGFHRVTGGLEVTAGLLLLIPSTSRAGAMYHPEMLEKLIIINGAHPFVSERELRENPAQRYASNYFFVINGYLAPGEQPIDEHDTRESAVRRGRNLPAIPNRFSRGC